jgi:membrane-associated PAP2 superfamily phosphatase
MPTSARRALSAFLLLLLAVTVTELTPVDLSFQQLLYSQEHAQWLWQNDEPIKRFLLYDGIKRLLVAFGICLLVVAVAGQRFAALEPYRRGARIVLLSLILVPATVSLLKATTHVACPRHLLQFGGDTPYLGIIRSFFDPGAQAAAHRCFPAGHASGGYALLALFFLFPTQRGRRAAVAFAVVTGSVMGGYKMLIGDHFLSHTVVTLLLAWLLINVIVLVDDTVRNRLARGDDANPENIATHRAASTATAGLLRYREVAVCDGSERPGGK